MLKLELSANDVKSELKNLYKYIEHLQLLFFST